MECPQVSCFLASSLKQKSEGARLDLLSQRLFIREPGLMSDGGTGDQEVPAWRGKVLGMGPGIRELLGMGGGGGMVGELISPLRSP